MIEYNVTSTTRVQSALYSEFAPARRISEPKPSPVARHSARRVPTRARGAATRGEPNSDGSALGSCTLRIVVRGVAPYARSRSSDSFGVAFSASVTFTNVGKKV